MSDEEFRPSSDEMTGEQLPYPARQSDMKQQPDSDLSNYLPAGKLKGKVALITGADSGIGRAVAVAYAMEGANVAIVYNQNDDDARETQKLVEQRGQRCLVLKSDVRSSDNCHQEVALGRPGQPEELAPAYVFLASSDGSFVTGALMEVTGGRLTPG